MIPVLILLGALLLTGLLLRLFHRPDDAPAQEAAEQSLEEDEGSDSECCGMHAVCEKTGRAQAADTIAYYDDEELDRWAGTPADDYPDHAVDSFREVMLTLLPSDAPGWSVSLQRRGIELPAELRDELLMIIAESASHSNA